ncbi:MAG: trigger factor [Planctomycetota bacterium]|jgi:trigger factor
MSTQFFTEANPHSITVEDAGPCRKKLTIEVEAAHVDAMIDDSTSSIVGQASLPGFRQGKAPRKLIERRFGQAIRDETKEKLVGQAYKHALEEHKLRVVGEPEAGDELRDMEITAGQAVTFTVEVEVVPEFTLPPMSDLTIKRPMIEVTDEDVQNQLDTLSANEGELQSKQESAPGDYLVGHGVLRIKGNDEPVHDIEGSVVQVPEDGGRGMVLGVMVDDFGKQLGTPKVGDEVSIKATGPDQHEVEEIRGKDLEINFTVGEINAVVPATLESLAERMGPDGNVETLREAISGQLEHQVRNKQQHAMRQQVSTHLLETIDFELPEKLTAQQALRTLQRKQLDMQYQGMDQNEIESHLAELRNASDESARKELKLFFILDQVANEQDLQITEQDLNGFIVQMAMSRGLRPDVVRQELINSGNVQQVARQLREHKALDLLLGQANVEEVSVDDYNEFVAGIKGEDAPEAAKKKSSSKKKTSKKKTTKKKTSKKSDD